MTPDDPRLALGRRLYDAGRHHEAHEAWEELWRLHRARDPELGRALRALIQLTAAAYQAGRGRTSGASSLYTRAAAAFAQLAATPRRAELEARLGLDFSHLSRATSQRTGAPSAPPPPLAPH